MSDATYQISSPCGSNKNMILCFPYINLNIIVVTPREAIVWSQDNNSNNIGRSPLRGARWC